MKTGILGTDAEKVDWAMMHLEKCSQLSELAVAICKTILENLGGTTKDKYAAEEIHIDGPYFNHRSVNRKPNMYGNLEEYVDWTTCYHSFVPIFLGTLRVVDIIICQQSRKLFFRVPRKAGLV